MVTVPDCRERGKESRRRKHRSPWNPHRIPRNPGCGSWMDFIVLDSSVTKDLEGRVSGGEDSGRMYV